MHWTGLFFNLLANSALSLLAGLLVVLFFIWLFRVQTGPWKLFLFSLPFIKIVFDCLKGLPRDSILFTNLDPYTLPPKHQVLSVSAGFDNWGPLFGAALSVDDGHGKEFSASLGDYLSIWLGRRFGPHVPLAIVGIAAVVAFFFLIFRFLHAYRFEKLRILDNKTLLRTEKSWWRPVEIYLSESFSGTPFTGGLWHPYICIPRDAFQKLNEGELNAVIAHEIGHVRQFDLVVSVFIQIVGDLFWFIPGYGALGRKIDRLREIVADQWVVRSGQNPALLASALLKLKEIPQVTDRFVLYSAFFREKSLLKTRVDHLLGDTLDLAPRFGWQNHWLRCLLTFWIVTAVMFTTIGGNQKAHGLDDIKMLDHILHFFGLM